VIYKTFRRCELALAFASELGASASVLCGVLTPEDTEKWGALFTTAVRARLLEQIGARLKALA
jgi:hypothetical protein